MNFEFNKSKIDLNFSLRMCLFPLQLSWQLIQPYYYFPLSYPALPSYQIPKKILSLQCPEYISNSTISIILTDICSKCHNPDLSHDNISAERSDSTPLLFNLFFTQQPATVFLKHKLSIPFLLSQLEKNSHSSSCI